MRLLLDFVLTYKLLALGFFIALLIFTFGAVGGGIIGVTLFPRIASDQVAITLDMPNGTNENVTDSIISMIEDKAEIVNKELTEQYLAGTR